MDAGMLLAAAFAPVEQEYLLEARQMQALSFAVHIPLVCFGIAFPAMVLLRGVAATCAPATRCTVCSPGAGRR